MTDEPVGGVPDPFEAAILGLGPDPTMTAQELFVQGAEAKAAELGERHGLSMLGAGLERLLTARGYDFTEREIVNFVHSHDTGHFWDQAAKPESLDLSHLAHALDLRWARTVEPSWDLRNVLEGRATSGIGYRGLPRLDWIEAQVADALKAKKIRRGTKKHFEFVEQSREKVVAAAVGVARQDAERQRAVIAGALEKLNKDRDGWVERVRGVERGLAFRRAMLDVTGTAADPRADKGASDMHDLYARVIAALDSSINYLQVQYAEAEADVEKDATEAMRRSKELAPFAGVPACGCAG